MKHFIALTVAAISLASAVAPAFASYDGIRLWNPKIGRAYVDWCLWPATQCGKPAADNYCRSQGYGKAKDFSGVRSSRPTYIMGTGELCTKDKFDHCDRFKYITCRFR